jgi:hypothetical protein
MQLNHGWYPRVHSAERTCAPATRGRDGAPLRRRAPRQPDQRRSANSIPAPVQPRVLRQWMLAVVGDQLNSGMVDLLSRVSSTTGGE